MEEIKSKLQDLLDGAENHELVEKSFAARRYYDAAPYPAPDGRSRAMDTTLRDAIEWALPSIMDALSGEVCKFTPMSPQDEQQANLETEFVSYCFNQENNGFLNLHTFVKDALLNGVAFFKVWYDDTPERVVENYSGLQEPQLEGLLADPMVEVTNIERLPEGISVTLARIVRSGQVRVECVEPEKLRYNNDHCSVDLSTARIVVHSERRSASELLAEGYDFEIISQATESYLRHERDDEYVGVDTGDDSQKQLVVSEAYCRMDLNDDGISELVKIVYLGEYDVDDILGVEEVDAIPFFAGAVIPSPHQVEGVSFYDMLNQLQDSKTAVLRSTHDNFYQANNRQKVVITDMVNLDDLKVSRPGGIIRAKGPGAVTELGGQSIAGDSLQFLEYLDRQRADRTGVSSEAAGQNEMVGNESAHGIERVMTARELKVGLMIRSIAETGIKPVFKRIRDLMVRFHNGSVPMKFKDTWTTVDPSRWGDRSRMAVTVGTGAGLEMQKTSALQFVMATQEKLLGAGSPLVGPAQVYAAIEDYGDIAGLDSVASYFVNPTSPEGAQALQQKEQGDSQKEQQQMEAQKMQLQAQSILVQAEVMKGQAQLQANQVKMQSEQLKAQYETQISQLEIKLRAAEEMADQKFQFAKLHADTAIKLTEIEVNAGDRTLDREYQSNRDAVLDSRANLEEGATNERGTTRDLNERGPQRP